ncbi:hypothetical protein Dimus_036469, partial [Dionaea muscipula]
MKKVVQSRAVGCEVAEKLSGLRPRRRVESGTRCESDLNLGLRLSPIVEATGCAMVELQGLDGVASPSVEEGQISGDLREPHSQVISSPSSLLPLEMPNLSCSLEPDGRLEEKGEGLFVSVQGPQLASPDVLFSPVMPVEMPIVSLTEKGEDCGCTLQGSPTHHVPVALPDGRTAEFQNGHGVNVLRTVRQVGDFNKVVPLMAGAGLGKVQSAGASGDPECPLAQ